MRDILTALAGLLVLALAAALALPPFLSWEGYRESVDAALSRATGLQASTEGRIGIRFLPSPRLRVDGLTLAAGADRPSLDARAVEAEVALAPLLKGDLHFTEARIGRAEIRVPVGPSGAPVLPALDPAGLARDLAVEDLAIGELLVTRVATLTGRTDQVFAEAVRLAAPSAIGPWRAEGRFGGAPFRVATGALDATGAVPVKLEAGGGETPRLDVDARLALPSAADPVPRAAGTLKLVVGPPSQAAGPYVPLALQSRFATEGASVRLDALVLDLDPGGAALRLNGRGTLELGRPLATLSLDARRLDLDAFLTSAAGQALLARRGAIPSPPLPVDVTVGLESAALFGEDWTALALEARFAPDGAVALRRLAATAPGAARLEIGGEAGAPGEGGTARSFSGHVALNAPAPGRIARMLERAGVAGPLPLLESGRPLEIEGDVSLAPPVASLRNARVALGGARIAGNARYTSPDGATARGRFDAQLSATGLDVADLPPLRDLMAPLGDQDLGLSLIATDVRYGASGARGGRITAAIRSDGPALRVDSLEIANLAGADARVSGRIAPDGTGRITGHVSAPRAAPLIDLATVAWGGMPRRLPAVLRTGALDLDVTAERAGGGTTPSLVVTGAGHAAGASLRTTLAVVEGRAERFELDATAPDSGAWLGKPGDPGLARPGTLRLAGTRREGRLSVDVRGEAGGVRLASAAPLVMNPQDGLPDSGALTLLAADAAPLAALLGEGVRVPGPLPADLRIDLSRERDAPRFAVAGRAGGGALEADLRLTGPGALSGSLGVERLSLPRLLDALALNPEPESRTSAGISSGPWPTTRFRAVDRALVAGTIAVKAASLDLGRGLIARDASFTLAPSPDGLALRDAKGLLADGRLSGTLAVTRQEGQASLSGEMTFDGLSLTRLGGSETPGGATARLSGTLRFGASGETPAALAANLAGNAEVRLADLAMPRGDPDALGRTIARALKEDDPLRAGRIQDIAADELSRGPMRAAAPAIAQGALFGGLLRLAPLTLDLGGALWQGSAGIDLRTLRLDARGSLAARSAPPGWSGPPPALVLGYAGSLADPARTLDASPLVTGLAAIVLKRELDTIELYEEDASERTRRQRQLEMDRTRAADAARRAAEAAQRGADAEAAPAQP